MVVLRDGELIDITRKGGALLRDIFERDDPVDYLRRAKAKALVPIKRFTARGRFVRRTFFGPP